MRARLHSWWQKISKPLDAVLTSFIGVLVALTIISILGYRFHWDWTGLPSYTSPPHPSTVSFLPDKTLWDWLQLLIIPAVLAIGGYLFNYTASRNEREATKQRDQTERDIASDNQREAALQTYIDKISELLLEKHLRESKPEDEVRTIARVRTLTTLPRLDEARKGNILRFLYESKLIDKDNTIIDLEGADLNEADLGSNVNLNRAYLSRVQLREAWLSGADLREANLSEANLTGANLLVADLRGADLSEASLIGAKLTGAKLDKAYLREAILSIADLSEASLSGAKMGRISLGLADLSLADLSEAYLSGATLNGANLTGADLSNADLSRADLSNADLSRADLRKANLSEANLNKAIVTQHQLDETHSLRGTILPDGSKNET